MDLDDNTFSFTYEILERPSQPVLRFLPGSVTTVPNIPVANEPYVVKIRVDNLGSEDAISLNVNLKRKTPGISGWQPIDEKSITVVPGAMTTLPCKVPLLSQDGGL